MSPSVEDNLWKSAGVRSVSELPDFPFPSHKDFIAAVRNGAASVGIEYPAARDLAHVTKSRAAQYALFALGGIPILFIPASIVVAIVTGRWATLIGIPTALIGMALASPYNPLHHVLYLASIAAVAYCLIAATVLTAVTWSAFAFGLSFLAVRFVNRTAWSWAKKAILGSEALTAYLWKTKNLHIKGKAVDPGSTVVGAHRG
jgi:hypothetical protein